jgi:hypothetical protein
VVAGRIVNVYEEQDTALKLFKYVIKKEAIGNVAQYIGQDKGEMRFENYDVAHFVDGHLDYRCKLGHILDYIQFDA